MVDFIHEYYTFIRNMYLFYISNHIINTKYFKLDIGSDPSKAVRKFCADFVDLKVLIVINGVPDGNDYLLSCKPNVTVITSQTILDTNHSDLVQIVNQFNPDLIIIRNTDNEIVTSRIKCVQGNIPIIHVGS